MNGKQKAWLFSALFLITFFVIIGLAMTGQFRIGASDNNPSAKSTQSQEAPHGNLLPGILPDKNAILTSVDLQRVHCTKGWRPYPKHPPADLASVSIPVLVIAMPVPVFRPEQAKHYGHITSPAQPRAPPFSA